HDPQGQTLYVCSDGGIAFTRDLWAQARASFDSSLNAGLANLQFQSYPGRGLGSGPSDVSVVTPNLIAGAAQDVGVLYSFVASDGAQQAWQRYSGDEDGQRAVFLKNNLLLSWTNDDPDGNFSHPRAGVAMWIGDRFEPADFSKQIFVKVRTPSPTIRSGDFLYDPLVDHV